MDQAQGKRLTRKLLNLMRKTGYPLVQHNGERKFGPPSDWVGSPPPKGCEIFIGKLPRDVYEDELVPIFSSVGKIYELRLMMDFSGSNRGYAFLTYATKAQALKAVKELNKFEIQPGKHIGVVKSVNNRRLFVGGIPKDKTKEDVLEELSKRITGIVNVILHNNCYDTIQNGGFAFVEFTSHKATAIALRSLLPGCIKLWDCDVMVDWAELDPQVNVDRMLKHLEKKEYAKSFMEESASGSGWSVNEDNVETKLSMMPNLQMPCYVLPPARLDAMCKRHMWALPIYDYQKYIDYIGRELWIGKVLLPRVGSPLLTTPCSLGPLFTPPCFTMQEAHVKAADCALYFLKNVQYDQQQSTIFPIPTMFSHIPPPVPTYVGLPCEYVNTPVYQTAPQPMTLPVQAIWRNV